LLSERDVEDTFQILAMLDDYRAAQAALRITEEQMQELEAGCDQMRGRMATAPVRRSLPLCWSAMAACIRSFWRRAARDVFPRPAIPSIYRTYYWYTSKERQRSFHYHRKLVEAFRRRDMLWAESAMKSHVHAARNYLVARPRAVQAEQEARGIAEIALLDDEEEAQPPESLPEER